MFGVCLGYERRGGGCLMGPDEQPSVQKSTITDCHHPHTHVQVGV